VPHGSAATDSSAAAPPGQRPRILWVTGMARSGSTWVFNVARLLLLRRRVAVKPDAISRDEVDYLRIANEVMMRPAGASDPLWMFKTHLRLSGPLPGASLICTYRDPRDALVSFQRFMHCAFERALEATGDMVETTDHYRRVSHVPKLELEFREITGEPEACAARIARHLGLVAEPAELAGLCRALSKPAVRALIADSEAQVQALINDDEPVPPDLYVTNVDGTARAFDPVTGFQSGHVSDYRDGDWQSLLSADQIRRMQERLGPWLKANGY
jgi:hypothetical protein